MYNDNVILNPFPGLRAFEEEEDILFFGREKQIDELLRKLRMSRFLAIIGSSGSGKSSLVKSGMLPALHSGLMSGAGSKWRIALFRPGNDPIGNLNDTLSKNGVLRDNQSDDELDTNRAINESILRRSSLGLIEAFKQSGLDKKDNLLVLVDQFEELFRFSKYEKDAAEGKRDSIAFINLLLKAAEQKEFPIYVVFTMRSDFLGDCTEFRGLPEAINEGQYLIPRMTREERREAITGPIAVGGATIAPALLNRLLNDVGDNPDQLPLLQHALMRTWDAWTKKNNRDLPIDIEDYENIGTISSAISKHAEEAYMELKTDKEKHICEKIFKELTDKGGMLNGIRRPRLLSELSAAADATDAEVIRVVEIFRKPGRGFLMPAAPAPLTSDSIIDISHESLMRVWTRLIEWLAEEEESAQVYLHLCEAANLYEAKKGGLWRDPELQIALKWQDEQKTNAAWASRYNTFYDRAILFLEHSKEKRDQAIKYKEKLQKQRLRTTKIITIVVSVIALFAIGFMIYALQQKNMADIAENKAELASVDALGQKKKALDQKREAERLKAVADLEKKSADSNRVEALKQAGIAIFQEKVAHKAEREAKDSANAAVLSRNDAIKSKELADISKQQALASKDSAERSKLKAEVAKQQAERLKTLAESKNNAHKATMYANDKQNNDWLSLARSAYENNLRDTGDFQDNDIYTALLLSWEHTKNTDHAQVLSAPVRSLVGQPGAQFFYSGDESGNITLCQYNGSDLTKTIVNNSGPGLRALAIAPREPYLVAVMLNQAILFKINQSKQLQQIAEIPLIGTGKHAIFLDDKYYVVQCINGVTRYEINNPSRADTARIANCNAIALGHNGKIFISSGRTISEYAGWDDLASSKPARDPYKLESTVTSIGVDATGKYMAAGTYDGWVWLFSSGIGKNYPLHHSAVNDVKFNTVAPGKLQLASASSDRNIKLTEVTKQHTLYTDDVITLTEHTNWVYSLLYLPDSKYLFSGSEDKFIRWWPTTMEELYNQLPKK